MADKDLLQRLFERLGESAGWRSEVARVVGGVLGGSVSHQAASPWTGEAPNVLAPRRRQR